MQVETHDVIVIGAGVAGICLIKHLTDRGFDAMILEANDGLGGTWYRNRYPGCRFDSESYTYGYQAWPEILETWHWKEKFSPQPENLNYLNFVADTFDLHQHIRLSSRVASTQWDEDNGQWTTRLETGEVFKSRFVVSCVGALSASVLPKIKGIEDFDGAWFHTYDWPAEPIDLTGKRVGIVGTGATGIQIIADIADKVGELYVFQRHANWSAPLNNYKIDDTEMAAIRARYPEIFANCAASNGGFEHVPDRRGYADLSEAERRELWDHLYDNVGGFSLLLANFPETFLEEEANRDLSNYVADRIRQRVKDPETAEKLIPKDHGVGMRRLPLETNYFEAYNRDNVHLVDLQETPIERVTAAGIATTDADYDLDLIIYATGFDAITGALNRIDVVGTGGQSLREKWRSETRTYLGVLAHGFPNLIMVAGPQSVSGSTNYPRAIETSALWICDLLAQMKADGQTRIEATAEAEDWWTGEVVRAQNWMPFSKVKSWFTGYNPNARSDGTPEFRYNAYWGGAPRYADFLNEAAQSGYSDIDIR